MNTLKKVTNFILLLLGFVIVYLVPGVTALGISDYLDLDSHPVNWFIMYLLHCILCIGTIAVVVLFIHHQKFSEIGFRWTTESSRLIRVGFTLACLCLSLAALISYLAGFFEYSWGTERFGVGDILITVIFQYILGNVLIAVYEETFWRGYVMNRIQEKYNNPLLSIVLSAFLFTLVHISSSVTLDTIVVFLGGLIIGYMFYRTKSIYIGMGLHFGWNFLLRLFSFYSDSPEFPALIYTKNFVESPIGECITIVILCAVVMMGLLFEWWCRRKALVKV